MTALILEGEPEKVSSDENVLLSYHLIVWDTIYPRLMISLKIATSYTYYAIQEPESKDQVQTAPYGGFHT